MSDLREAARQVVANWEHGDLAAAVRELDAAVKEEDALDRKIAKRLQKAVNRTERIMREKASRS